MPSEPAEQDRLERVYRALWGEEGIHDGLVVNVGKISDKVTGIDAKLTSIEDRRKLVLTLFIGVVPVLTAITTALLTAWLT